jgi:hypothetical protein
MLDGFNEDNNRSKFDRISADHYSNSYSNKFTSISSTYNDDPRFASISSDPITYKNDEEYKESNSTFYSYLGIAYNKTKAFASIVKDKIVEMDLGSKLKETGGKTVDVLKYTGSKVYEKGSEVVVINSINNRHLIQ